MVIVSILLFIVKIMETIAGDANINLFTFQESNSMAPPQELETFLPKGQKNVST